MSVIFFWPKIILHAQAHGVDPYLMAGIIQVESEGKMFAVRYEPKYKWFSSPGEHASANGTTIETETELQKFSFGLCQIMGGTLRDLGHKAPLPQAFDPEVNLEFGAKLLENLMKKYPDVKDVISAYNAGSPRKIGGDYVNQGFVDAVTTAEASFRGQLIVS